MEKQQWIVILEKGKYKPLKILGKVGGFSTEQAALDVINRLNLNNNG